MDFFKLLNRLDKYNIDFVIIGGFAGAAYGCSLMTKDLDICIDCSVDNLLRLQEALADLNPVHRMTPQKIKLQLTKETAANMKNLYLNTDLGQLDCISFVNGVGSFKEVKAASRTIEIDSNNYRILNLKNLIESKKAMGRPQDQQAAIQLEAIEKKQDKEQK